MYCHGSIPNSGALVNIMNMGNGLYSRDLCGIPTHGSYVLLEFESIIKLTEYLRFLYSSGVVFELKGVKILNFANNEQLHT